MRSEVKLSKRLERIASFVKSGSIVADIGTDHGYVPIWLVQKGICPAAFAMDVRKGPLDRAKEHVHEMGLSKKIELRLSDGLEKLKPNEADTVIIAGMGGKLTCRILEQGRHVWEKWSEDKERLILSPQSEQDEVRHFLEDHGFKIIREDMLEDEGKYYVIIEALRGLMQPLREQEYIFGEDLIRKKAPVLLEYLEKEERTTRLVLEGLIKRKESEKIESEKKKAELKVKEPDAPCAKSECQTQKETAVSEDTVLSRLEMRISELKAYLALIEETKHEMQ